MMLNYRKLFTIVGILILVVVILIVATIVLMIRSGALPETYNIHVNVPMHYI